MNPCNHLENPLSIIMVCDINQMTWEQLLASLKKAGVSIETLSNDSGADEKYLFRQVNGNVYWVALLDIYAADERVTANRVFNILRRLALNEREVLKGWAYIL